ncbi:hypothetical protein [Glaciecola sp. SC05]|uniref:hypothetical protein n=1 Tax=Glaciecola sp. SC05 TaxID=1987355 RepID=UPI003529A156
MAKKKDKQLKVTEAIDSKSVPTVHSEFPAYEPFVIIQTPHDTRAFKVWFEVNGDHMVNSRKKNMRICKGMKSSSWIVSERLNIPQRLSKEVARTFALWLQQELPSYSAICNAMIQVCAFMDYLNEKSPITDISEFNTKIFLGFEKEIKRRASYFKPIFSLHPRIEWKQLHYSLKKKRILESTIKPTSNLLDEDSAFSLAEYSEREHFQIVGYAMHRIELMKNRRQELFEANAESLAKIGCYLNDTYPTAYPYQEKFLEGRRAGSRIRRLYDSDRKRAIELLHLNMLIIVRDGAKGRTSITNQINSLRQHRGEFGKGLFSDYLSHIAQLYEPTNLSVAPAERKGFRDYKKLLLMKAPINEFAIILIILIQTGINLEVALSLKRFYGKVHWTKRYDVNLGIDAKTISKRQVLRLTGIKKKTGVAPAKEVDIRVPVDSYLYQILKMYEDIFAEQGNDLFYSGMHFGNANRDFFSVYKIVTDSGEELSSIATTKIRKSFAGASLAKIVEEVGSGQELERRLRESLSHENFDTTIFSYLMKTGVGHLIYSSAVVALTNQMLEDAITFKGKVCSNKTSKDSSTRIPVYLCDCEDPTKPSHDVPIANRCKQYDLCLGCERSEVYAEHIPRICYRILQYEQTASPVDALLADRKAIALDCLVKFERMHPDGQMIIEQSYQIANNAMLNNKPLLPAIL